MKLWHVSEPPEITVFEPRAPSNVDAGVSYPCVWAVADSHLVGYLLPRECPRIAVRYQPHATQADIARFLGRGNELALFIEASWHRRVVSTVLWLCELPPQTFVRVDANAGYFVSSEAVIPLAAHRVESRGRVAKPPKGRTRVSKGPLAVRRAVHRAVHLRARSRRAACSVPRRPRPMV